MIKEEEWTRISRRWPHQAQHLPMLECETSEQQRASEDRNDQEPEKQVTKNETPGTQKCQSQRHRRQQRRPHQLRQDRWYGQMRQATYERHTEEDLPSQRVVHCRLQPRLELQ